MNDTLPAVCDHLDQARADVLAFASLPTGVWTQIWSNNPHERLNREIRRRTDSVGIFPNRQAIIRLVGAVLAEQNDEWAEGRRYLSLDILTRSRLTPQPTQQEDTPLQLSAYPHPKDTKRLHHSTGLDLVWVCGASACAVLAGKPALKLVTDEAVHPIRRHYTSSVRV